MVILQFAEITKYVEMHIRFDFFHLLLGSIKGYLVLIFVYL